MNVTRSRGFTLMELLVVVLIIGLLTGIVAPRLMNAMSRSEATAAKAQIAELDKALQTFRMDVGRYPTTAEGLQVLVNPLAGDPRWRGPYLKDSVPLDPWGSAYVYATPSARVGKDFDLTSYGRDRAVGGTGDDADITN